MIERHVSSWQHPISSMEDRWAVKTVFLELALNVAKLTTVGKNMLFTSTAVKTLSKPDTGRMAALFAKTW